MQYPDFKVRAPAAYQLTKYSLALMTCLWFWFFPATHKISQLIDAKTFSWLNASLQYSHYWQLICGYLNHPNESWLNVAYLFMVNTAVVFTVPEFKRKSTIIGLIYFWLFFQIILLFTHFLFSVCLDVQRTSPSLNIMPTVILSDVLNMPNVKTSSQNCFPAGHTLIAIYWANFSLLYSRGWLRYLIIFSAVMLILPRLFTGAHWLSDILFTTFYAALWFNIANSTNFIRKINHKAGIT